MKGPVAFVAAVVALWLGVGGVVALVLHTAVVEVVCLELTGLIFAVLSAGLLIADSRPRCDHSIDCSDTWGGS